MKFLLTNYNELEFSLKEYVIIAFYIILGIALIIKLLAFIGNMTTTVWRLKANKSDVIDKYYKILLEEPDLRKLRFNFVFLKTLGIALLIISLFFITNEHGLIRFVFFMSGFVISILKLDKEYIQMYKKKIITAALAKYDENLSYSPNGGFTQEEYLSGFDELFNKFTSEDYIYGHTDGLEFRIADVKTEDWHDSQLGGHYVIDYHGPVGIVVIDKEIDFNFQLARNDKTDLFVVKDEDYFVIDNPEFDSCYRVDTDDKVKAAMLLTPSLTNKLLDLYKNYGVGFNLKIIKNRIYVKFQTPELFKPNILNRKAEAYGIAMYFEILDGIKGILKEISKAVNKMAK